MSVKRRKDERVSKAQKARDKSSVGSQSLFAPASGSAPLPNRRPTSGAISKYTPSNEKVTSIPPFRGEEQPVEKWAGLERPLAVNGRRRTYAKVGCTVGGHR